MTSITRALQKVRRREKQKTVLTFLMYGLAVGSAAALLLQGISFFVPIEKKIIWLCAILLACPLTAALAGLLLPVRAQKAAQAADACGLKERVQTALSLEKSPESDMKRLQYADAMNALDALDVKKAMPFHVSKRILTAALSCMAACAVLFFVPNPQNAVLQTRENFSTAMEETAKKLEEEAKKNDLSEYDEKTALEMRKLLTDLAKNIRKTTNAREAMTEISKTEAQLERLKSTANTAAMETLAQEGMNALSEAMQNGMEDIQKALEDLLGQEGMEALAQAMQNASASAQNAQAASALSAAAQAISAGNLQAAAQALSQLAQAGQLSASQLAALMQGAKANALSAQNAQALAAMGMQSGAQGSGSGLGLALAQSNTGGAGAGKGSTNEAAGYTEANAQRTTGTGQSGYKMGEYEQIYDPTRLGDGGEVVQTQGSMTESGTTTELTTAPSLGDASGSVPYDQVAGEYKSAAVTAADNANLPEYARDWVTTYFNSLIE